MLELIDLDIRELSYRRFISAWLCRGQKECFLIDPGPACTIGHLMAELEKRNVSHLGWILLTHIHMDHAGGIGHLVERFPDARVVCHKKAVRHLVDPGRLWEGSLKILGHVAEVYGAIKPVPHKNIMTCDRIPFEDGIRVINTPGHAAHHQCFITKDTLFCGELFGIFHQLDDQLYLRPATPPVFVLEDFLQSMDAVAPFMDRRICFAHHGQSDNGREVLSSAREQINLWVDVVKKHIKAPEMDRIMNDLSETDPIFKRNERLPEDLYTREMHFTVNSIKGILAYLKKKAL